MKRMNVCQRILVIAGVILTVPFCVSQTSAATWQPAAGPLKTRWAKDVSPESALPEYPRPQMVRQDWFNLNGLWDFAITSYHSILSKILRESRFDLIGISVSYLSQLPFALGLLRVCAALSPESILICGGTE